MYIATNYFVSDEFYKYHYIILKKESQLIEDAFVRNLIDFYDYQRYNVSMRVR